MVLLLCVVVLTGLCAAGGFVLGKDSVEAVPLETPGAPDACHSIGNAFHEYVDRMTSAHNSLLLAYKGVVSGKPSSVTSRDFHRSVQLAVQSSQLLKNTSDAINECLS